MGEVEAFFFSARSGVGEDEFLRKRERRQAHEKVGEGTEGCGGGVVPAMSRFWSCPAARRLLLRRSSHHLRHMVVRPSSSHEALPGILWQRWCCDNNKRWLGSAAAPDEPDYDPTEARTPPSEKIHRLVDEISTLTLLEVSDLTTLLKKRLGLPAGMGMMPMGMGGMMPGMGMPGAAGGAAAGAPVAEEKKPEKTSFDVKLEKFEAASKIKIIKEVRAFTALGLKEAKELVEKAPTLLKQGVGKEEAEQIIEKLKAIGGTAIME